MTVLFREYGLSYLDRVPVVRVQRALKSAGSHSEIIELESSARTASAAAAGRNCELGSIVKSLVFSIGDCAVMALIAGDRYCEQTELNVVFKLSGSPRRADAKFVQKVTGFSIGGVAPIGLTSPLPITIDKSLGRFQKVYAAAGHPHLVFESTLLELTDMTNAIVSEKIAHSLR